jgi:hypothetical protein
MTSNLHARRVALIDRPWMGHWSILLASPLELKPFAEIRAVFAEFIRDNPDSPFASRIDVMSGRWLPVPAAEREAHVDRVLTAAADPDPDELEQHVAAHLATAATDLPVQVMVSPSAIVILMCHAVGDAITLTGVARAFALAQPEAFAVLTDRVGTSALARAFVRGLRPHHRDWVSYLRHRDGPPATASTATPAPVRPAFVTTTLSNAVLRDLTRWRNANAHGVSMTSVLASLVHKAFQQRELLVHDHGLYTLIDIRPLLSPDSQPQWGNFSKSLYLTADLAVPSSIEAALREARTTDRALPATVVAAGSSALNPPRPPETSQRAVSPVILTFNSIPTLPGLSDLPWREDSDRRFYGFGLSMGPGGITVNAIRLRAHMELIVTFDEATASPATVRRALEAVQDPTPLLTAPA